MTTFSSDAVLQKYAGDVENSTSDATGTDNRGKPKMSGFVIGNSSRFHFNEYGAIYSLFNDPRKDRNKTPDTRSEATPDNPSIADAQPAWDHHCHIISLLIRRNAGSSNTKLRFGREDAISAIDNTTFTVPATAQSNDSVTKHTWRFVILECPLY